MRNSRRKSAKLNMITGLLQEVVALICGLILPRTILLFFGSSYNGIVNSIAQFLTFSTVLRSGLGAATHAVLYKPLADKDMDTVSGIMSATNKFMHKVGFILAGSILVFAALYPLAVMDEFDYLFSFSLVIIIGISAFAENMFSIKYRILLQADQKYYVQTLAVIATQVLSTAVSVALIYMGGTIHVVRLGGALAYFTTPLFLNRYVKKHYDINWKAKPDNVAMKQRWNAFTLQIATIVNNNVDTVILTIMVTLKELSVYSVYYMVVNNITKVITSCMNGFKAIFGDMLARGELQNLKKRFQEMEWALFAAATVIFSTTAIMLTPFVMLYTRKVTDVDYNRYYFGLLMVTVHMFNIVRIPFQQVVEAAGHFRQVRTGAIMEVVFNIVFSIVFSFFFGIIGVLLGTVVAVTIRTTQFGFYACRHVVKVPLLHMIKNYTVYFSTAVGLVFLGRVFVHDVPDNYLQWGIIALITAVGCTVVVLIVSLIFNQKQFKGLVLPILKRRKKAS